MCCDSNIHNCKEFQRYMSVSLCTSMFYYEPTITFSACRIFTVIYKCNESLH
uniref:Uncharacterized protein n=1 Tax=Arundo donax TaxID=35708 RepID=A0A0A9DCT5_ARUDO